MPASESFIGIDVQSARDCPYAVLDTSGVLIKSGWIPTDNRKRKHIAEICARHPNISIGIDSPRIPLPSPRAWYWSAGRWNPRTTQVGSGRHCEVIIKAHDIANPQWTPVRGSEPEWMSIGFELFRLFEAHGDVYEIFPSASYHQLRMAPEVNATLSFSAFKPGPKDMLDAAVGALTVLEYKKGNGEAVGGGDGLGEIVLPRPIIDRKPEVFQWPG